MNQFVFLITYLLVNIFTVLFKVGGEDSFVMTENNQQSVADSSRESQNQQSLN